MAKNCGEFSEFAMNLLAQEDVLGFKLSTYAILFAAYREGVSDGVKDGLSRRKRVIPRTGRSLSEGLI